MKDWTDIMLESLAKNWVDLIFGYPGGAIMPFYDKLEKFDKIKHILVRNEQWAAFAAQWISRSSKKLWVAVATSGPWATNLITWIMDAYMDSIPSLFITWQVPFSLMWSDLFQEVDIVWATMSCTKHNFVIDDVSKIPEIVKEAIKIATTWRPGPVLIDFPKDIQLAKYKEKEIDLNLHYNRQPKIELKQEKVLEAIKMIKKAERPVLLIGQWVRFANAEYELQNFVNSLNIPTVSTLLAKWTIREDNPNYLWMLGMHGFYEANMAVDQADLIINIGSRFDDRIVWTYDTFWKNAKIIHIDIDKSELNKVVKTDLAIHANAKDFLNIACQEELTSLKINAWREKIKSFRESHPFVSETDWFSTKNALNSINKITTKNLDNYIFVTDVWQHQMWSAQILKVANTWSWLTSGGAWTMWFGLPTAMWAASVNPDKQIILIVWDWSIQMNIQELQTIAENNFNVKIILMNNNFLWMVRQWQDLFFNKNYASTPITSPDYQKLAEAYNIRWYAAESEKDFEEILNKELSQNWPALIEVRKILDEDNIFPMVAPGMSLKETLWCRECLD